MFTCRKVDSSLASKAVDPVLNGHDLYFSAVTGSSMQSFCCMSVVKTICRTQKALVLWKMTVDLSGSHGYYLRTFCAELLIVQLLFEGGDWSTVDNA